MARMASLVGLAVLLEVIGACGSQQHAATHPASRITGTVAAGPMSPVARPGAAATRPVPGATIEALNGSKIIAVARTDRDGRYTLSLPPGSYVILVKASRYLTKQTTKTAAVSAGQTLTVGFVLDTGIR
jgi:hypothetical protein